MAKTKCEIVASYTIDCSNACKMDGYVLRRAKAMLEEVGVIEFHRRVDRA